RERDGSVVGRKRGEHRGDRPGCLPVPHAPGHDEDRPRAHGDLNGAVVRQESDLDLPVEDVEQFVAVWMTLPWALRGEATYCDDTAVERGELRAGCLELLVGHSGCDLALAA